MRQTWSRGGLLHFDIVQLLHLLGLLYNEPINVISFSIGLCIHCRQPGSMGLSTSHSFLTHIITCRPIGDLGFKSRHFGWALSSFTVELPPLDCISRLGWTGHAQLHAPCDMLQPYYRQALVFSCVQRLLSIFISMILFWWAVKMKVLLYRWDAARRTAATFGPSIPINSLSFVMGLILFPNKHL